MQKKVLEKYMIDYVFVVLVYRNTADLEDFLVSTKEITGNYKVIVVNAYFDEKTKSDAQKIAEEFNCDFLNIENKGYSYGNNIGIEYAHTHYDPKFVIVSNPDIVIRRFDLAPCELQGDIIAPDITAATGKKQNPMMVRRSKTSEKLIYQGFKKNNNILLFAGIAINKITRILCLFCTQKKEKFPIYCAHGSFVILSKNAIEKLGVRIYDEEIFLFAEESVLAYKAHKYSLTTIFDKRIRVDHKEDGSMKLGGIAVNKELSKANIYYYEHYVRNL